MSFISKCIADRNLISCFIVCVGRAAAEFVDDGNYLTDRIILNTCEWIVCQIEWSFIGVCRLG